MRSCSDSRRKTVDDNVNVTKKNTTSSVEKNGIVSAATSFFILISGLGADAVPEDILGLLKGCQIVGGKEGVKICRFRRVAFIELASDDDVSRALLADRKSVGTHCVNVERVERDEMESIIQRARDEMSLRLAKSDGVVRLRGLPFQCSKEEIMTFFLGLPIAPNGITLICDEKTGLGQGEGFVQFARCDLVEKALERHKAVIQHRYIEVYESSMAEMMKILGRSRHLSDVSTRSLRPRPYDLSPDLIYRRGLSERDNGSQRLRDRSADRRCRGRTSKIISGATAHSEINARTDYCIYMRGMPYSAADLDICDFLYPVVPVKVILEQTSGRSNGNAFVYLATRRDVEACLRKNGAIMKHRYVEIFHRSPVTSRR